MLPWVVLAVCGAAGLAEGSILRALTPAQLRADADLVVVGRVLGTRTLVHRGTLETEARVRVQETLRGAGRRTVVRVLVPGGSRAGRRLLVPGAPRLQRGDHLLLFLYRDGRRWRPVGLFQGVWRVTPDDPGAVVASGAGGATLLAPAHGRAAVERGTWRIAELVGGETER